MKKHKAQKRRIAIPLVSLCIICFLFFSFFNQKYEMQKESMAILGSDETESIDTYIGYFDKILYSYAYDLEIHMLWPNSEIPQITHIKHCGTDHLISTYIDGLNLKTSLWQNGSQAIGTDLWLWEQEYTQEYDNTAVELFSLEGKQLLTSSYEINDSGTTVQFDLTWDNVQEETLFSGVVRYYLSPDNSLKKIDVEILEGSDEMKGLTGVLIVNEKNLDNIKADIEEIKRNVHNKQNEVGIIQSEMMEHPSNNTTYDRSLKTYFDEKNWAFFDKQHAFTVTVDEVSATGLKLIYDVFPNENLYSLVAGEIYFVEKWNDGTWVDINETSNAYPQTTLDTIFTKEGNTESNNVYTVFWGNFYGELKPGFYRVGRYYTVTLSTGEIETQVCYAKFRIYDDSTAAMLQKTKSAISAILNKNEYHLLSTNWNIENIDVDSDGSIDDLAYYYTSEVIKYGSNYIVEYRYINYENNNLDSQRGEMLLDGNRYHREVNNWMANNYVEERNFQIWTYGTQYNNAYVYQVTEVDNKVSILELSDFYDDVPYVERVFYFNDDKDLIKIDVFFVKEDGSKIIFEETTIYQTQPDEIARMIDNQRGKINGR